MKDICVHQKLTFKKQIPTKQIHAKKLTVET